MHVGTFDKYSENGANRSNRRGERRTHPFSSEGQGHQELSGESDENNPLKPNQSAPSIYIMIEICYYSLDQ